MILILRDEDKWIESFRKFFEAEQNDFAEMKWHRLYGHLYRFIFPHTGRPMRVYMDFLRSLKTLFEQNNENGIFYFCVNNKRETLSIRSPKWTKVKKTSHLENIFLVRNVTLIFNPIFRDSWIPPNENKDARANWSGIAQNRR